jgi:hypothetical protein
LNRLKPLKSNWEPVIGSFLVRRIAMNKKDFAAILAEIEPKAGEEITEATLEELSNGKEDNENE